MLHKTFVGSVFSKAPVELSLDKAIEEVLMNVHFSEIVKDEKIGLVKMDFNYLDVEMLYNSLTISPINVNLVSNHFPNNIFPFSIQSNFTFRLFPVQIKDITSCLFVAQTLTE